MTGRIRNGFVAAAVALAAAFAATGAAAPPVKLILPYDLEARGSTVYIADGLRHQILRYDLRSRRLSVFAGTGRPGTSGDGGPARRARLTEPTELVLDACRQPLLQRRQPESRPSHRPPRNHHHDRPCPGGGGRRGRSDRSLSRDRVDRGLGLPRRARDRCEGAARRRRHGDVERRRRPCCVGAAQRPARRHLRR